uniref:Uncharacterized protein n=1 Tax=Cucumis melo TaxID=3656 RepID=A0A9I9D621_CUCME
MTTDGRLGCSHGRMIGERLSWVRGRFGAARKIQFGTRKEDQQKIEMGAPKDDRRKIGLLVRKDDRWRKIGMSARNFDRALRQVAESRRLGWAHGRMTVGRRR